MHAPNCATGARAEKRGPCDCGAVDARPWRLRPVHYVDRDQAVEIEIVIDRVLTTHEAMDLALTLQHLAVEVSHGNIARAERAARKEARNAKR